MTEVSTPARPGVGALLRDLDHAPPADLVDVCAGWLARHVGAEASILLLADYAEASLQPVAGGPADARIRPQDLADSAAGEAYREQRRITVVLDRPDDAGAAGAAAGGLQGQTVIVYLPVSVRAERIGVLTVTLPGAEVSLWVAEVLDDVARVLGHVLTGARRYTDRFEMLRRRRELGLAAEIQWELLPSLALAASTVYPLHPIQLRSGDRLVLLTDGITEAHKRGDREFGYPRLVDLLVRHHDLEPAELIRLITREVVGACDGKLATLVCLDWRRPSARD